MISTQKLKSELIELFNLEGVQVDELRDDDHLFGDGLGLDSVDAIELNIFLDNEYNIVFDNIQQSETAFKSIQSLQQHINTHGDK